MGTSMSAALGEHGARNKFTDPDTGREWEVRFLTHKVMAEYESWLKSEALAGVMAMRGAVTPDDYAALVREVTRDCASGAYGYEGDVCSRSVETPRGLVTLAGLLLWDARQKRHPTREELEDLLARRGLELGAVVNQVCEESRQRLRPAREAGAAESPPGPATTSTPS